MKRILVAAFGCAIVGFATQASAVNCEQVKRYLSTGRSVEEIAETMIVSVDEVKKCAPDAAAEKKDGGAAKPAEEKKAE
jgi:hypothetical protein